MGAHRYPSCHRRALGAPCWCYGGHPKVLTPIVGRFGAPKGAHPHSWALWGTPSVRRGGSLWPLPPSSPRLGAGGGEPRRSFPPPIPPADLWAPMGAVGPTQPAGRPGVPQVLHGPTARRDQPQGPQDPQHPIGHPAGAPPRGQRHREVRGGWMDGWMGGGAPWRRCCVGWGGTADPKRRPIAMTNAPT